MKYPSLLLLLCILACSQPSRPNIIYIMTDDHATQMMSAYGSTRASTPNLDRIARAGILFRNAFCTNSLCAPSRATLLTGLYSHKNGQRYNGETFDGSQTTFPKLLQQAGYQTALVGKWHLLSEPTGFDYWNILPGQGDYRNPVLIEMGERKSHQGYVTDIITDLAMDWIRHRDPERPFSLNLDSAPTILDYAGVDIPPQMQGRSLRPLLEGRTPEGWREMIYYQYHEPPAAPNVATHYGVRTDRYKLIHYSDDYGGPEVWELIDLEKDPLEYVDFYDDPAYADIVRELKEQLRQLRREFEVPE